MGGIGSGNHWQLGRTTTDAMRRLDVRKMARDGALAPGSRGSWIWSRDGQETGRVSYAAQPDALRLSYSARAFDEDWEKFDYVVRLERTPCHLGGARVWFGCPAVGCGRRVAILYGGRVFACRHCHQLAYRSTRLSDADRASDMAHALRQRLDWPEGLLDGPGWAKPNGMHWRTYEKHLAQYERLETRTFAGCQEDLRMLTIGLELIERRRRKKAKGRRRTP